MQIGALRKRLTLQQESISGGALVWTTLAALWGEMTPITSERTLTASGSDRRVTHTIRLRYPSDLIIATGMRLVHGARTFTIRAVTNVDEDNRVLEITAEEGGTL